VASGRPIVLDDRLLIEELLVGLRAPAVALTTTAYWYYRACRAAVSGAAGHLSGPFAGLDRRQQSRAIRSLLALRDDIGLPDPRRTVPVMAELSDRHRMLNLLTLEAAATGIVLGGTVWLSGRAAVGVLPGVLDAEGVAWRTVEVG
jgi:hypothetical protein